MYTVNLYRRVRRAHFVEGMSIRQAARMFNLHRNTIVGLTCSEDEAYRLAIGISH